MGRFHRAGASIDHLERLGRLSSPVHSLSCAAKLAVTFIFIALVISIPRETPGRLMPFFIYPAILLSLSSTPLKPLFARLAVALPFALAMAITNIIFEREPVFSIAGLAVTRGVLSSATLILKTTLCVFSALLLIATTPFSAIAGVLTKNRLLRIFGLQIMMSYRYIGVLIEEAGNSWTAYMLRSPSAKAIKLWDMGAFLGGMLLRSMDKAGRVYNAMKCRGFYGVYVSAKTEKFGAEDIIFMFTASLILVFLRFFDLSAALGAFVVR
ncbi:MAG: hypothetical protein Pg6A_09710 [Termitinemataceae bacterium]|nr:MAG: hypothetical protein Pg6A_09710 [Termitinemataceae bacterium]